MKYVPGEESEHTTYSIWEVGWKAGRWSQATSRSSSLPLCEFWVSTDSNDAVGVVRDVWYADICAGPCLHAITWMMEHAWVRDDMMEHAWVHDDMMEHARECQESLHAMQGLEKASLI